jgi:hypothetical protein
MGSERNSRDRHRRRGPSPSRRCVAGGHRAVGHAVVEQIGQHPHPPWETRHCGGGRTGGGGGGERIEDAGRHTHSRSRPSATASAVA